MNNNRQILGEWVNMRFRWVFCVSCIVFERIFDYVRYRILQLVWFCSCCNCFFLHIIFTPPQNILALVVPHALTFLFLSFTSSSWCCCCAFTSSSCCAFTSSSCCVFFYFTSFPFIHPIFLWFRSSCFCMLIVTKCQQPMLVTEQCGVCQLGRQCSCNKDCNAVVYSDLLLWMM